MPATLTNNTVETLEKACHLVHRGFILLMINLVGTLNVFDAAQALGIQRIVFTSSAGVYGLMTTRHLAPLRTVGVLTRPCKGTFKLACEGSARACWEDRGIASIVFGPTSSTASVGKPG